MRISATEPGVQVGAALPDTDLMLLDEAFERALASWEEGTAVSAAELVPNRPDLADQVERIVALAQEVAVTGPAPGPIPTVPGYTVLSELGRGAMGAVYLARQDRLGGRPVALKVLPAGAAASSRARERFQAEANAIARLRHPHIVTVYDVVREGTLLAFAMEPIDGPSLHDVIDHLTSLGRPARAGDVREFLGVGASALGEAPYWTVIARVGSAVARALDAVHGAGLLHRDVKPSNILMRRDGTPLLSDFGLVRDPESGLVTREGFVGTPAYAPPEQLAGGLGAADARSDIHALGATLYHALALRTPFAGRSPAELHRAVDLGAPALRSLCPALPRDLCTIVAKAMAPSARDRYATAGDLADDLDRLLAERPIHARPAGAVSRAVKLLRRNRQAFWGTLGGAIGVLVLVAALVTGFVLMPRWAQEARERAWLALLDPRDTANFANAALWEYRPPGRPRTNRALIARALAEYDAAARWQPWDERTVLERDAIAAMSALSGLRGERPRFAAALARRAPRACEWLTRWVAVDDEGSAPPLPGGPLSRDDLIALGMMSYVSNDMTPAVEAWQGLERAGEAGPFARAGLGLYFIYAQAPGRAYPRLEDAERAFRGVSFLRAARAEAACGVGDVVLAAQLLAEARGLDRQDEMQLVRVGGLVDLAEGNPGAADRFAAWHFKELGLGSGVSSLQLGRWLAARGESERAVSAMSVYIGDIPRLSRLFMPMAEAWWDGLSEARRVEIIEHAIATRCVSGPWGFGQVPLGYQHACFKIATRPNQAHLRELLRGHPLEEIGKRLEAYRQYPHPGAEQVPPPPRGEALRAAAERVLGLRPNG